MALETLFARQKDLSVLPRNDQLLIETCTTREEVICMPIPKGGLHEGIGFRGHRV